MYSTDVFIYTQKQIVVLPTGNSPRRFMPVYSKILTLNKGVDNLIQFQFLNQQQKPVDISGMELTFRILSAAASRVLLSKTLNLTLPLTGIAVLDVESAELEPLDSQRCYYTIEYTRNSGNTNYAVFMDQIAGARGDLVIADSVLPAFQPCQEVTIPSDQLTLMSQCAIVGMQGTGISYYSSAIVTYNNPCLTFQASYTNFSGNVTIEGSVANDDTSWYPITTSPTYNNLTNTEGYTIDGYHPYVRLKWTSWAGTVGNVLVR